MSNDNPYQAPEAELDDFYESDPEDGQPLASRWLRFWGAVIDTVIQVIAFFMVIFPLGLIELASSDPFAFDLAEQLTSLVFGFGLFLLIHGYPLLTRGQTIGKMLLRIQIVSYSDNKILPFGKLFVFRYLILGVVYYIPFIGTLMGLVNACFIFGEERRCIHDLMANTKVVMVKGDY